MEDKLVEPKIILISTPYHEREWIKKWFVAEDSMESNISEDRLKLADEPPSVAILTKRECQILYRQIHNEFVARNHYDEFRSIINKIVAVIGDDCI